ncbi:Conserved_hypothetical protein [Hexamita inflata]|uniref:Uncharacterized protein n=1 Tax=Hexamita inflata TaxID=28002 RepID=A0AA86QPN6_9EUKA|nr:Conserved hypothetical protein [Hexamita inflata]
MPEFKNKVFDSMFWCAVEFGMAFVYGVLLIFGGFLVTGADAKNFYNFVPNLHTETACYADSAHPLLHIHKWEELIHKKNVWFGFFSFYGLQTLLGICAYWIQRKWMEFSYPQADESVISTLILFHQVCSFFICTTLETWSGDGWAGKFGPLTKSMILYGSSWLMWLVGNNEIAKAESLTVISEFNHFHLIGSFATSIILTNLFWCNIFSVQDWSLYKAFKNPGDRFGNMGFLIFFFAIIQWLVCYGLASLMFKHEYINENDTFMAHSEGAWTILCYFWYGMTIVGAHVSPHLWRTLNKSMKGFGLWFTYCGICLVLGLLFTVCLYEMFVLVLDPLFIRGVLKVPDVHKFGRPGYLFAFGAANIPYTYQMIKQMKEQHDQNEKRGDVAELVVANNGMKLI